MSICDDEKVQATDRLLNELAKGRTSGEEKGWHSLEEVEAKLGSENEVVSSSAKRKPKPTRITNGFLTRKL